MSIPASSIRFNMERMPCLLGRVSLAPSRLMICGPISANIVIRSECSPSSRRTAQPQQRTLMSLPLPPFNELLKQGLAFLRAQVPAIVLSSEELCEVAANVRAFDSDWYWWPYSLIFGNLQGISCDWPGIWHWSPSKTPVRSVGYDKIPYAAEQGIFLSRSGKSAPDQGLQSASVGTVSKRRGLIEGAS
jgi:hypothetical protein